jgi:hypothetical protein
MALDDLKLEPPKFLGDAGFFLQHLAECEASYEKRESGETEKVQA